MPIIEKFVEINSSVGRVFDLAGDFESFPRWMSNIKVVRRIDRYATRWTAETAFGTEVQWEAVTTHYKPDQRIVWHAVRGQIDTAGEIVLSETQRGTTLMHFVLDYEVPAGISHSAATTLATVFGDDPWQQLEDDLQRFKRIAERSAGDDRRHRRSSRVQTYVRREDRDIYLRDDRGARRPSYRLSEPHLQDGFGGEYDTVDRPRPEPRMSQGAQPRLVAEDQRGLRYHAVEDQRRGERFDEALREARRSQLRDMERYNDDREHVSERQREREINELEMNRRARYAENPQYRNEQEVDFRQERERIMSPRERARETQMDERHIDRDYSQRLHRRGVDLLLEDEAPSRRFRRRED